MHSPLLLNPRPIIHYSSRRPHCQRVRRIRRSLLQDVPMLHNAASIHTQDIHPSCRQNSRLILSEVNPARAVVESRMHNADVDRWHDGREEGDGVVSSRQSVGIVLNVIDIYMIGESSLCIFVYIEFRDEFVEDCFLCRFVDGSRRAVACSRAQRQDGKESKKDVGFHDVEISFLRQMLRAYRNRQARGRIYGETDSRDVIEMPVDSSPNELPRLSNWRSQSNENMPQKPK